MVYKELNNFSQQVHKFIKYIRKDNLSTKKKHKLYFIVKNLKLRTNTQKDRFLLYYNLVPNQKMRNPTLKDIGNLYNCTSSAVRHSILRVTTSLCKLENESTRKQLLKIIYIPKK